MKRWIRFWLILSVLSLAITLHAQPAKPTQTYVSQMKKAEAAIKTLTLAKPETSLLYDTVSYRWISYKAKVAFVGENLNNNCQLFFVNKIDSIIYLKLHVSGVEIMRVVLTPTEVTLVNKLDHAYYQGGYEVFLKLVGMQADFNFIQALFNKCDFRDFEKNLQSVNDNAAVWKMVSPLRRHLTADWSIMQNIEKNLFSGELQNEITDLASGRMLTAKYLPDTTAPANRYGQLILNLPMRNLQVTLTPKNMKFNVPGPTSIKIPDKFTRLTFEYFE